MSTPETLRKLNEMKCFGMVNALEEYLRTGGMKDLSPEEGLALLVDAEHLYRKNTKLQRLLQLAKLKFPQACLEEMDYRKSRELQRSQVHALQNQEWIESSKNVLISGSTGVGKSYFGCALGQWACRQGYPVLYQRWPRLLGDLLAAKGTGGYLKHLARLARVKVLILDDFGLHSLNDQDRKDFLEIIEDRYKSGSTIITSQLPVKLWHEHIGDPTIADAVMDRLVHNAFTFELKGESMRKENAVKKQTKD